jgi:acyl dehydratase
MRVGFKSGTSGQSIGLDSVRLSRPRVVLHRAEKCEENSYWNTLATVLSSRTITPENNKKSEETGMTSRIEPYRVSAYNTSKHSENKMHDDTVAKRYGFVGGLVPGVDVMAYMMHLPVAKWGRAFLERGLIEARFVKPVYDGERADVTGEENNGVLAIQVESRGELCATGTASLPPAAPSFSLSDFVDVAAVGERKPVDATSYALGKWLGAVPRTWAADAAKEYLADIRETEPIYTRERLGHPGLLPRVMNKVLVDNAIMGPWIHVGTRMQLLFAGRIGDELTARAKVVGNYDKKGHRFVELDALVVANGRTPLAHCHHIAIYQPREQAAA